jgi:aspartyl-tRNA(Asn)/glutamyl-tRNA(Gln) amidotransferase subunit C
MLTDKDIEHIAGLARIKIDKDERKTLKKELSLILDYMKSLNKVKTDNVDPLYQSSGVKNEFQSDEHRGLFDMNEQLDARLLGQSPRKEKRFVKVKSVLQK